MRRGPSGILLPISSVGELCRAFVPHPLPPSPPLEFDAELSELLHQATLSVGRLDGIALLLPEPQLFLYAYVRKEAVLSSQIEGTQSSLSDLLLFEMEGAPGVPLDDVQEVSAYVAALNYGLQQLRGGMPLSLRMMKEMHAVLLARGRGSEKEPGEFKRSQNWIGGTRPGNALFVPTPPDQVIPCLGALEKFLHNDPSATPILLKAGLAHVQFETIHPFLDGNGRMGRLLITLLLCAEGTLREPLLYLSLFLKQNRAQYYELLQLVRTEGAWEVWLKFFFRGVHEIASGAVQTARRLLDLFQADRQTLRTLGRAAGSALQVHDQLQRQPVSSIRRTAEAVQLSVPAVGAAFEALRERGIVSEVTGGKYGRVYAYHRYLAILSEGTEPLP